MYRVAVDGHEIPVRFVTMIDALCWAGKQRDAEKITIVKEIDHLETKNLDLRAEIHELKAEIHEQASKAESELHEHLKDLALRIFDYIGIEGRFVDRGINRHNEHVFTYGLNVSLSWNPIPGFSLHGVMPTRAWKKWAKIQVLFEGETF